MKSWQTIFGLFWAGLALICAPRAFGNSAGAVILVNSQSTQYLDYVHFLQPYLGNFGVPYTVLDISSNAVTTNLTNYALIIIGHAQLDSNLVYLNAGAQSNIALAVSNGTGLVSFDNVLSSNKAPLYQFEQSIFGFGYTNPVTGASVVFPPTQPLSQMPYITSLHLTNETLWLSNANNTTTMTVAGLTLPSNATAVATCGGAPFVVTTQYGQGRAVQWTSYAWMSSTIQGPVNGLDDLVWRGFVWAARKPFVMRGFPHLATIRVDDCTGDPNTNASYPSAFWWAHAMTNAGFKPFLALMISDVEYASWNYPLDGGMKDLSNLVTSGKVTVSIHSFSNNATNFFFFDHATETQWPDSVMSNNFVAGENFFQWAGFPSSKVMVAHYSEMGTNSFNGLTNLGVQFVMIEVVPGTVEYANPGAPWLVAGPYRLYETPQPGQVNMPMFYADWLQVPNHPELNGKFFDCYTEIRNVSPSGEWAPTNSDIPGSILRGYNMMKRGFDSMTLGNIFSHEWYLDTVFNDGMPAYGQTMTSNNFVAMLQGITNDLAPYNPIYVTMDYAFQYVRATRTSQITNADYNPANGQITATLSGSTDLPITAYYYTGSDNSITDIAATVPIFSGSTNLTMGTLPVPVVANNDAYTVAQASSLSVGAAQGVLANDTGGGSLSAVLIGTAQHGSLALNSDGSFTYVPSETFNGADSFTYQATNGTTNSPTATVTITVTPSTTPAANNDVYTYAENTLTTVSAQAGVLANDADPYGSNLAAVLVSSPTHGTLNLNSDGSFTYAPFTNSTAADSFTYEAEDGITNSTAATVTLTDPFAGAIFSDNFTRPTNPGSLSPWLVHSDNWAVTNGAMVAGVNPVSTYANVYLTNNWTNVCVQGQFQFPAAACGGGLGGCLNTNTGGHYAAWIYPESSPVAPKTLMLMKFTNWSNWSYNGSNSQPIASVPLASVGTNWHTLKLAFDGRRIAVYFDGTEMLSAADADSIFPALTNGGVSLDMETASTQYQMLVANVSVSPLAVPDSYSVFGTATLLVTAPGVLANDTEVLGSNLTASLLSSPTNGTLTFTNNGGFSYTPTNPAALDSFVYQANDGLSNLGTATVTINHVLLGQSISFSPVTGETYGDAPFTVSATASSGLPLTLSLVSGPATISNATVALTGAGTVTLQAAQGGNAAYSPVLDAEQSFAVSPAPLTVTANDTNKAYGAANPEFTASYGGFVNGDTAVSALSGTPSLTAAADTNSPVGTYAIAAAQGNLAASNYAFSFSNGVLTVNQAALMVSANNTNRTYGQTNPVFTACYGGFVNDDTVGNALTGGPLLTTIADTNSPVGAYAITAAPGTLASSNYVFSFSNGVLMVTATPPLILSVVPAGTNVVITWSSLSNADYRLEYSPDLSPTNWQNLVPDVTATNVTASNVDNPAGASWRFYRVQVLHN